MRQPKPRFLRPDSLIDNKPDKTRKVMTMLSLLTPPYLFKDNQNKYSFDLHRTSPTQK